MEFFQTRTDLAIESREILQGSQDSEDIQGVKVSVEKIEDLELEITKVEILDNQGAEAMNKAIGNYITIESPLLTDNDMDDHEEFIKIIARELMALEALKNKNLVLVVGLGNWDVTPDALGPKVISGLLVTRHLIEFMPDQIDESVRAVSAISPGVLGITGIETGEIIQGIVEKIKPDVVIAIDALAARKASRLNTTIQISDTGVHPGSGVGNKRMGLTEETLGVPVLAVGVPTVIDAATLVNDTMDQFLDAMRTQSEKSGPFYEMLQNVNKEEKYQLIRELLDPYVGNLFVTPKDIDATIDRLADMVAESLNLALHPGLDTKDIGRYIQ
ncbi:MAG: GPR endopeptidase [Epulopiscium sp.]|nr:GPR endopeptidase [Candidatus Epulonipiscium sp.]